VFGSTFVSTRGADADGLKSHFFDCAIFCYNVEHPLAICVIDELGLANLNQRLPLQLLHYYFDKGVPNTERWGQKIEYIWVLPFAASTSFPDYATINRGIVICIDTPTDEELPRAGESGPQSAHGPGDSQETDLHSPFPFAFSSPFSFLLSIFSPSLQCAEKSQDSRPSRTCLRNHRGGSAVSKYYMRGSTAMGRMRDFSELDSSLEHQWQCRKSVSGRSRSPAAVSDKR
jgi:hypothetical protein